MEGLERMVSESFARHGVEPAFDYRRLQWSQWFRCADSFSLVLMSSKPGVFALGEEIVTPGAVPATGGKRMLALFQISETDDLGMALSRLFLPGSPERERLACGRCFARYAVIKDATQRHAAHVALQRWLASSFEIASGITELGTENQKVETGSQTGLAVLDTGN
jgi:hypothetical protein